MNKKSEIFLNLSLKYKREYQDTTWWKFYKRYKLKKNWYEYRDLMVKSI